METIKSFLNAYGWGFLMLIGSGFLTAGLIEVIVKNPVKWLQGKWAAYEKLVAVLMGVKAVITQVIAWTLCTWFSQLVCKVVALPGADALLPIWVALSYLSQYVFSCFGIKGVIEWAKERESRKSKDKPEKPSRPKLERTEYRGVYKNEAGELVDKHGNPVKF